MKEWLESKIKENKTWLKVSEDFEVRAYYIGKN